MGLVKGPTVKTSIMSLYYYKIYNKIIKTKKLKTYYKDN